MLLWLIFSATGAFVNVSSTSYFVACALNAATTVSYLPMQNGEMIYTMSSFNESEPWTIWSPGSFASSTSELVEMVCEYTHLFCLLNDTLFSSILPRLPIQYFQTFVK